MKQIRRRSLLKETNSSSSHSISIRKLDEYYTELELMDGIYLYNGRTLSISDRHLEFDRSPFKPLTTFYEKVGYAIASYSSDKNVRHEIENILYEKIPGLKTIKYPQKRDWETDRKKTYYGYVDHQSIGTLQGMLERHNVTLREFLIK